MIISDKNAVADLKQAIVLLETPNLTAKISNLVGSPIEIAVTKLPKIIRNKIQLATSAALEKAVDIAFGTLNNDPGKISSNKSHKLYVALSGAIGGIGGITSFLIELPISTTIIMRSIADIARSEGFDLSDLNTKEICIEVFALGGKNNSLPATDSGYYASRTFTVQMISALAKEFGIYSTKNYSNFLNNAASDQAGKWLAKLVEKVASRFGIIVSEKFASQAVPVIGAISGAVINTLFINYFQDMARGHFIIKRLERQYGEESVQSTYMQLLKSSKST